MTDARERDWEDTVEDLEAGLAMAFAALRTHRDYCEHARYVGSADVIQASILAIEERLGIDSDAAELTWEESEHERTAQLDEPHD